jgi:cytochrome P450
MPRSEVSRPPGPDSTIFGFDLLQQSKRDYLGHIGELKARFGDVVRSKVVNETIFDIHHPDLIREVLIDNADALIRWERGVNVFANIHGQSVLVSEGAQWQRQRRMLQPGFSPKRMRDYCELMASACESALAAFEQSTIVNLEFEHWAHQLTMDVILQTLFSQSIPAIRDQAIAAVAALSQIGMAEMFWPASSPDWMPHKSVKRRAKRLLDELIRSSIRKRREQLNPDGEQYHDVLSMLLSIRDETGDGGGLSDDEIRDQCMTIFLAGHETTALALSWWAWLIASHPKVCQQVQAEIDMTMAGRVPRHDDLANLRVLTGTLKEALRLYPPVASLFNRRTLRDIKVGNWTVPRGAMVRITPWFVHRDERWFPDPNSFRPERFDEGTALLNRQSYMPFGTGPRVCIGSHFALTEMTLIAAYLLQRFSFRSNAVPRAKLAVLLFPEGGIPLQLIRRIH